MVGESGMGIRRGRRRGVVDERSGRDEGQGEWGEGRKGGGEREREGEDEVGE